MQRFMKTIPFLFLISASLMLSCSSAEPSESELIVKNTLEDLPNCSNGKFAAVYYVVSTDEFYFCDGFQFMLVDLSGQDGDSCTVTDDGGGATITCEDGTSATVSDGTSCTVTRDEAAGTTTISCEDGTVAVVEDGQDGQDGTSCTIADTAAGATITCGSETVTITDGEDGSSCSASTDASGAVTISCDDGTSATIPAGGDGGVSVELLCEVIRINDLATPEGLDCSLCGNGALDPGEFCDPPNGITCDAECQRIPTCGDGFLDPGEQCDPPDGVFCDASCQSIPVDTCDGEPDGTACDDFAPDTGVCIAGVCEPVPPGGTQTVNVLCSNNVTADISDLPYELSVTPLGPVVDGVPVDFAIDGVAQIPPSFLNAALATIPGLTEITLTGLTSTMVVRSGAAGPDVALVPEPALPTQVPIPITSDSAICTAAGLPTPCVLESLLVPLAAQTVTLTPNGGPGGEILFGWDESRAVPIPVVLNSPGPISTRFVAVVLQVGLECTMGICRDGGTCDDPLQIDSLTDAELISIPIAP